MLKDQSYWLHKLANLRIDRACGDPAPHKPCLLLVILEMFDRGEIVGDEVPLSPDLAFRFSLFNAIIAERRRPPMELRQPFHHLKTSNIWMPLMADGKLSPHRNLTVRVRFDPTFYACLCDSTFRDNAKRVLIDNSSYFRLNEQYALHAMFCLKAVVADRVKDSSSQYTVQVKCGREARFRMEVVVVAYKHTCALTGYRMTTVGMESIVDAAHIHEFCDSQDNEPCNGLALSKNAHWQFDRGLWAIGDDYRVVVNHNKFSEEGVLGQKLADFDGRRLFLPYESKYWPRQSHIEWHRKHKFEFS